MMSVLSFDVESQRRSLEENMSETVRLTIEAIEVQVV
jgi:hypothetical protein